MFPKKAWSLGCLWLLLGCGGGGEEGAPGTSGSGMESVGDLPTIRAMNAFYYYEDVEGAWAFYTRTLGFRTVADYGFAKMLRVGPTSYLTLVDESRGMHSSSEPKSVTLAVVTDEVEGWWEYLSEMGVEMRSSLGTGEGRPHDGFVAVDPEGYLLEFERFNDHPENLDLLPLLNGVEPLYPSEEDQEPEAETTRPATLGVRGTVLWLYYEDLEEIQRFYRELLGQEILVDQGWAKVYPGAGTGFLGFVDGARGLHQATPEKAVTVSFFTDDLEVWRDHAVSVEGFQLRGSGITEEDGFVQAFVGFDPGGYFLEWDRFLEVEVNRELLSVLPGDAPKEVDPDPLLM